MKHLALALCLAPVAAIAQSASATFIGQDGREIGQADLTAAQGGVVISVDVGGLPPSTAMGFHVHEAGVCAADAGFETAGDHFNPADTKHGLLTRTGPHAGDMPNLHSDAEGKVRAEVFNPHLTLAEGNAAVSGRALIIHAGADDYKSQPSGEAGKRLACAVVQ